MMNASIEEQCKQDAQRHQARACYAPGPFLFAGRYISRGRYIEQIKTEQNKDKTTIRLSDNY